MIHLRTVRLVILVVLSTPRLGIAQDPAPPVSVWSAIPADAVTTQAGGAVDHAIPAAVDNQAAANPSAKRGEFIIAPIPMINPTLENGLAVVVGALYRLDRTDRITPPSVTMGAVFKTSNGSWGTAIAQQLHLHHDRYRLLGAVAYASINYDFFGVGRDSATGPSIPLTQKGSIGLIDGLVLVGARWYVGGRYQFMKMDAAIDQEQLPDGAPSFPARDADLRTAALGPRVERDSRDNPFYPRAGVVFNAMASFYGKDVGGQRSYQNYQTWISQYIGVGAGQVLAWRASACGVEGDVPFYDVCQLGKSQDLRGYVVGQYRDHTMLAAQAEYRLELPWRFGATAFIGAGEVAPALDRFTWDDALPGGGVGLRFTLARRNHMNLRADYAWGRSSHALYISVGEAF